MYCRIRPFLPGQTKKQTSIEYIGENGELIVANPSKPGKDGQRMFKFNKVFGPAATQGFYLLVSLFLNWLLRGYLLTGLLVLYMIILLVFQIKWIWLIGWKHCNISNLYTILQIWQLRYFQTPNPWYDLYLMDIMYVYLLMVKQVLEKPTQW